MADPPDKNGAARVASAGATKNNQPSTDMGSVPPHATVAAQWATQARHALAGILRAPHAMKNIFGVWGNRGDDLDFDRDLQTVWRVFVDLDLDDVPLTPASVEARLQAVGRASALPVLAEIIACSAAMANDTPGRSVGRAAFNRAVALADAVREQAAAEAEMQGGVLQAPVLVNLSDVVPQPIRWLWPGRIALGKLTLISGDPGLGKSSIAIDLAARVTRAARWPDGNGNAPWGDVVLLTAEDDLADTVRPRLDAANADAARVIALQGVMTTDPESGKKFERSFNLRDIEPLKSAIARARDCRLVIIDPIGAFTAGTDSHKNDEVRALLAPLSAMASELGVAVVAISHLNKGNGPAIYRTMGSLAWAAAARAVWAVAKDKADERKRLFLPVKNNIGPDQSGLAFILNNGAVEWFEGAVSATANDALASDLGGAESSVVSDAAEWLQAELGAGPVLVKDLQQRARDAGISWRSIERAKGAAGAIANKQSGTGKWAWALKDHLTKNLAVIRNTQNTTSSFPLLDGPLGQDRQGRQGRRGTTRPPKLGGVADDDLSTLELERLADQQGVTP